MNGEFFVEMYEVRSSHTQDLPLLYLCTVCEPIPNGSTEGKSFLKEYGGMTSEDLAREERKYLHRDI